MDENYWTFSAGFLGWCAAGTAKWIPYADP